MSSRAVAKNAENEICGTLLATFNRASAALDEAFLMSSSLSSLHHPFLELCHWAWGAFSTRMVSLLCFNNKSRRWSSRATSRTALQGVVTEVEDENFMDNAWKFFSPGAAPAHVMLMAPGAGAEHSYLRDMQFRGAQTACQG